MILSSFITKVALAHYINWVFLVLFFPLSGFGLPFYIVAWPGLISIFIIGLKNKTKTTTFKMQGDLQMHECMNPAQQSFSRLSIYLKFKGLLTGPDLIIVFRM